MIFGRRGSPKDETLEPDEYDDDELVDEDDLLDEDEYLEEPAQRRPALRGPLLGLFLGIALSIGAIFTAASVSRAGGFGGSGFTILVMGTDQRPDERGSDPGRTDSMMLVSVGRGGVSVVSIPRDMWVDVPGYGEGRINTAYRSGELDHSGSGTAVAMRTVSNALGVHVDRWALVDMSGVRDIVNQLGGVDVDNPSTIEDDSFPTDDYGTMSVTIPAGRQHLNGDLALVYARTRHQDNDFGRMGRQQQVVSAILAQMRSPSGLLKLPSIIGVLQRDTRTNLATADAASLAPALMDTSGDSVRRLVIGPDLVTPLTGSDGAALLQPRPGLKAAVASFLEGGS